MTILAYLTVWVIGALVMLVIAPILVLSIVAVDATLGGLSLPLRLNSVPATCLALVAGYYAGLGTTNLACFLVGCMGFSPTWSMFVPGVAFGAVPSPGYLGRMIKHGVLPVHLWIAAILLPPTFGVVFVAAAILGK